MPTFALEEHVQYVESLGVNETLLFAGSSSTAWIVCFMCPRMS